MSIQTWCIINKNKCTGSSASWTRIEFVRGAQTSRRKKSRQRYSFECHGRVMLDAWFSRCRISSWSPANRWRHRWWNLLLLVDKQKKNNEGHHSHQAVYSYLKDVSGKTPFRRRVFWFVLYFSFLFIHDKRDSAAALKLSTWVGRFVSYVSYF